MRDLDRAEGRSLKLHDDEPEPMQEEIDWEEPEEVDEGPKVLEYRSTAAPFNSPASEEQDEREKLQLSAIYYHDDQIPVSPAEPDEASSAPAADAEEPRVMKLCQELSSDQEVNAMISDAQSRLSQGAPLASDEAVRAILAKLSGSSLSSGHPGESRRR